mgnify:CR=1 FL=1
MCVHFVKNHQALHLWVVYFHVFMLYANIMFKIFRIFLKSGFISPRIFLPFFGIFLILFHFFRLCILLFKIFIPLQDTLFPIVWKLNWFRNNKAHYCHLLENYLNKIIINPKLNIWGFAWTDLHTVCQIKHSLPAAYTTSMCLTAPSQG